MDLTYALGLFADHDAEAAGNLINRVWATLERDPEMRARISKASAIEGSNAKRLATEFTAVTGLPIATTPFAYAQGLVGGVVAAMLPKSVVRSLFDSRLLDRAVELYWGAKSTHGDPRGREIFRAMIKTHHAEFDVFRNGIGAHRAS